MESIDILAFLALLYLRISDLQECLRANEELQTVSPRLTIWQALTSARLALWDETSRRLISFGEFTRMQQTVPA
jgi:hypothetical protein